MDQARPSGVAVVIQFFPDKETIPGQLIFTDGSGRAYDLEIPFMRADGKRFLPQNFIIYCPILGEVWAKRYVKHPQAGKWWSKAKPCADAGFGFLWDPYDEAWNQSLPYGLLVREIELIGMYYEHGEAPNLAALFPSPNFARSGYAQCNT